MRSFAPLSGRFWRMVRVPYQRDPLSGEGARLYGGRWNPRGMPALYMGATHDVAIAEYYRGLPKPGTLVPYDVEAAAIADLTNGSGAPRDAAVAEATLCDWAAQMRAGAVPPSWRLAESLARAGAEGALVPSVQQPGGTCLVLWHWRAAERPDDGAMVTPLDPERDLAPR